MDIGRAYNEGETSSPVVGGPPATARGPVVCQLRRGGEELGILPHLEQAVVIGAFGCTGRYLAWRLLGQDVAIKTLTRNPGLETPFGGRVAADSLDFSDPDGLRRSMEGAGFLYNIYWIGFGRGRNTFDQAVENTRTLFEAAKEAGVGRIVRFSVANAPTESRLTYFRSKGRVEEILMGMGFPYAINRPTLVFGEGDLALKTWPWRCSNLLVRNKFRERPTAWKSFCNDKPPCKVPDLQCIRTYLGRRQANGRRAQDYFPFWLVDVDNPGPSKSLFTISSGLAP